MHDDITINDFPEGYREVVEIVGIEHALALSKRFAGTSPYVPKLDNLIRKERDIKIRRAFNGGNIPELCQRFGLTEITIRNILRIRVGSIENFIEKEEEQP